MATVVHTTAYTVFQELVFDIEEQERRESWRDFFGYVLNATLAFLLVFRLNRAAGRYWTARELWGRIIAKIRSLCGHLVLHGERRRRERDEALRWLAALPLTIKIHIRGEQTTTTKDTFSGILSETELDRIDDNRNKALFVVEEVRNNLNRVFSESDDNLSVGQAIVLNQHYTNAALLLDSILEAAGGLERIKGTPLPIVYVSHLRTFLLLNINLFPYIWGPSWGWATIGVVSVTAFALLGIEASGEWNSMRSDIALEEPGKLTQKSFSRRSRISVQERAHQLVEHGYVKKPWGRGSQVVFSIQHVSFSCWTLRPDSFCIAVLRDMKEIMMLNQTRRENTQRLQTRRVREGVGENTRWS